MANPAVLTRRELGRATLARQFLLERSTLTIPQVVEHLAGVQAQTPHTWYVGLWSRIASFDPDECGALLTDRTLVRAALQRSTIHLVTARDLRRMRPLLGEVGRRAFAGSHGKALGLDIDEVAEAGRELTARRPYTFAELGRALAERWPGADPAALAQAVRVGTPLVQVPPRGVWGRSGAAAHMAAEAWLGPDPGDANPGPGAGPATPADLVRRYLAAYGPATVQDAQIWSGLRRLTKVFEELAPELVTFRDEHGRTLYDLPGAPRPPAGTPAPARFLYDFDNLLLSHADRTRVIDVDFRDQGYTAYGPVPRAVLLDGVVAASWTVRVGKGPGRGRGQGQGQGQEGDAGARLTVVPFRAVTGAERDDLEREGAALLRMLHPAAGRHDVVVTGPRP